MVFGLKGGIIGGSHEAGTGLDDMGKFVMTYDTGIGVLRDEVLEEGEHRCLLSLGPGIYSTAFLIQTSLVADAERTTVVVAGMSPTDILRENGDYVAVTTDIIMIGGLAETGHACGDQVVDAEGLVAARGAAVNNEQFDCRMLEFYFRHKNRFRHNSILKDYGKLSYARLHEEGGDKGGDDRQDEVTEFLSIRNSEKFHFCKKKL